MEFAADDGMRVIGVVRFDCEGEYAVASGGGVVKSMRGKHFIANPDMEELHDLGGAPAFKGEEVFDHEVVLLVPSQLQALLERAATCFRRGVLDGIQ